MKILVLSNLYPPDFLGGYELACRQAVNGLRDAGHDVLVLTGNPRTPVLEDDPGVVRHLRFSDVYDPYVADHSHQITARLREFDAYGVSAFNVLTLARTIESFEPDIVYMHNTCGLGGLGLIHTVQAMQIPWIMHLGDCVPKTLVGIGRVVHPEAGSAFVRATQGRFICVSQTLLNEIADAGIDLSSKSRFLPYWITTSGTPDRKRFFRPGETLRIVNTGALGTHKGTDILIQSVAELRKRGFTNVTVDLIGPGLDVDFRAMALRLGVQDQIRFCGTRTQQELYDLFPEYDLFAFPTHAREPFGMAPMEAAAHGCVPIVSELCGYSEWFVNGLHCLKAPRSAEGFAQAIEKVLNGQVDLPALARRSMAVTLSDFHLQAVLPHIEEELIKTVRSFSPGRRTPVDEIYRLAIIAEKSLQLLIQEADRQPPPKMPKSALQDAAIHEEDSMDFNFFNETSPGLARAPLAMVQRVTRRIMRPMFNRLRDLLTWLHHQDLEQQIAITQLTERLSDAEEALKRRESEAKALELDHLALVRRVATLEEHALAKVAPADSLNGLYKLDTPPRTQTADQRRAS